MWPHYNTDEAGTLSELEVFCSTSEGPGAVLCLNSYIARESQNQGTEVPLTDLDLGEYAIAQVQNSRTYKIVSRSNHEQELVVKVFGVLCSKTLPPFRGSLESATAMHRRKLRQHVKLCGASSPSFDDYQFKLSSILDFFGGSVGTEHIEVSEVGIFDGHYAVDFHTRYFEERRYAPEVAHIPFEPLVDPNGVLERGRGVDLVHGEQNIVEYCIKTLGDGGSAHYEPLDPQRIAVGDIVEVCATFTLFPYRKEEDRNIKYKLVHGMRSLSVLNHDLAKGMRQVRTRKPAPPKKIVMSTPKRTFLTSGGGSRVREPLAMDED